MVDQEAKKRLFRHLHRWNKKKGLRLIYGEYLQKIRCASVNGLTLEVGGGFGWMSQHWQGIISTDIVSMPNIDVVCDAHLLPFVQNSFNNVVAIDTLHHLERPVRFFRQVSKILKPGGRLVLVEPAITPFSRLIYKWHDEDVNLDVDPLEDGVLTGRDPFDSNQAIATLIIRKYLEKLKTEVPELQFRRKLWIGFLAYPLSGGFRPWSLLPYWLIMPVLKLEEILIKVLGRFLAHRVLLVFERVPAT